MDDMIAKPRESENHVQILKDLSWKKYKELTTICITLLGLYPN
jgi:predicted house-cleaning NTP pyrophosphatase (Maf/HAM1 superfamily)